MQELLNQDSAIQRTRLEPLHQEVIAYRKTRPLEFFQVQKKPPFQHQHPDPLWSIYLFERFNFWVALDDRDAAQALEKSITVSYEGSHPLFVNYPNNTVGLSSKQLVETFYPNVNDWKKDLKSDEALVSNERAQALIGFEAEYPLR